MIVISSMLLRSCLLTLPVPPNFSVSNSVCVCSFTGIGAGLEFMSENSIGWGPVDNPRVSTEMQSAKQYHCSVISLFLVPFCSMNTSPLYDPILI
jgi:hypothetical protein